MHRPPPSHVRRPHARRLSPSDTTGRVGLLVSRLPSEILLIIFSFVADHFFHIHNFKGNRMRWIRVLHVCRRWYQLGVGSSTLWCMVTTTGGVECAREVLRRSRGLPLYFVRIPAICPKTLEAAVLLLREAYRTTILQMHIPHKHRTELMRALASSGGMPLLQALYVCIDGDRDRRFAQLNDYFLFDLPRLVKLAVHARGHVGGMIRAPNLEHLSIKPWEGMPDAEWAIDADDLAQALRGMPRLAELWMEGMRPVSMQDTESHVERVHLPALDRLSLSGPAFFVAELARLISVPTTAAIMLEWFLKAQDSGNAVPLVGAIKGLFVEQDISGRTKHRMSRALWLSDIGDKY
ncbi:F-box protein [Phanerochaete sordida]|uniref:F-box protein n=1 Tax=Phanerochaete sordida TaxID=48140 RepID=A0A9P3LFZ9_9APHY|nr:F-box protein [Phanerochaete sordida]